MSKVSCQNCGALGEVGSLCAFCGTTIVQPATNAKPKKTRKKATPKSNDFDDYFEFWSEIFDIIYIPEDIFDSLNITGVYEFWVPDFVWKGSPKYIDRKVRLANIRRWVFDRPFDDNLPKDFPEYKKVYIYIIDYEYNNQPFWYIDITDLGAPADFWLANNKRDLSYRLSEFPGKEEYFQREKEKLLKNVERNKITSINQLTRFNPKLKYNIYSSIILICVVYFLAMLYSPPFVRFITSFIDISLAAMIAIAGIFVGAFCLWSLVKIASKHYDYKSYIDGFDRRIQDIQALKNFDEFKKYNNDTGVKMDMRYSDIKWKTSAIKKSIDNLDQSYWAYRKANPAPISSCQNFYKIR